MTIDEISMVERAERETERKIVAWLRQRARSPEGLHAMVALQRAAELIERGDYKE